MISTTSRAISYTTDGVQTVFSFPYAIIHADHLSVTLDGSAASGYTTVLNTDPDTGCVVTFTSAPTGNQTLALKRTTPITQLVDYTAGNSFNAETHENALDKLTLILQENQDDNDRALRAPAGTTTQTQITTAFYGKYLGFDASGNVTALDETVGSGSGSSFDLDDTSDFEAISVAASGTTTLTIPDTKTTIFGALVTVNVGAGTYTHNIKLPPPASTGQRGFIRISYADANDSSITIKDDADVTIFQTSGQRSQYESDVRVVASGASWVVEATQRGKIGGDQFQGATYVIPADSDSTPTHADLATAAADANPATIYLDNMVTFGAGASVEIPERHRLVIAQDAGINMTNGWTDGNTSLKIDCEIITASKDQPIFEDCPPGAIFGNFGGQGRNASWWNFRSTFPLLAFPDNWWDIQCALSSADWEAEFTTDTITNWNDSTNTITVADTSNFAEGDVVMFSGTLGGGLLPGRPYVVVDATNGAGDTLSTFKVANARGIDAIDFTTGGSLAATVSKCKAVTAFDVFLCGCQYEIDRPLDWAGSGATLRGNNATITAIAGEWANEIVEVDTYAGDHAPMLLLGETGPTAWSEIPSGVEDLTLNGGSIALVSGIGCRGHMDRRTFAKNVNIAAVTRHYVGWSKSWAAKPGQAAANDTSYLDVSNFNFEEIATSGDAPIPLHTPGNRTNFLNGNVEGDSSEAILEGANQQGVTLRDVFWSGANGLVNFTDDALFLNVHLDNVAGNAEVQNTISVTSTDTGTNTFTATGHNFDDGDVIRFNGTGTTPTGWADANAYVVINSTANTFQVSDSATGDLPFSMSADNGAFSVEEPGIIVRYKSTQATAKVTGVSLAALANEVVVSDTATHNKIETSGDDRAVDSARRADFIAWSDKSYTVISDGIVRCRGVILHSVGDQYTTPDKGEILLTNFDTSAGESFVLKMEEPGGSTTRWKYISLENANASFYNTTSDPEI